MYFFNNRILHDIFNKLMSEMSVATTKLLYRLCYTITILLPKVIVITYRSTLYKRVYVIVSED